MHKEDVLRLLLQTDGFVSGEAISQSLGVSRMAVCKTVEALRQEGFQIEAVTRRGYRLQNLGGRLSQAGLLACLQSDFLRERVVVLECVDSTNSYLKRLAQDGAPEGTTVISLCQTGGRGRLGRQFSSPAGGLYLSMLLRPQLAPNRLLHLTATTAVAACNAVERVCGLRPQIKWTNDLVVGRKKLGGILTELSIEAESGHIAYCVIGIGINCAATPLSPELADIAVSLEETIGKEVSVNALAAQLITELWQMQKELACGKQKWLRAYCADCMTVGQEVRIVSSLGTRFARAEGIGEDAELLVTYENGEHGAVSSGEVSVRGMYGYV